MVAVAAAVDVHVAPALDVHQDLPPTMVVAHNVHVADVVAAAAAAVLPSSSTVGVVHPHVPDSAFQAALAYNAMVAVAHIADAVDRDDTDTADSTASRLRAVVDHPGAVEDVHILRVRTEVVPFRAAARGESLPVVVHVDPAGVVAAAVAAHDVVVVDVEEDGNV